MINTERIKNSRNKLIGTKELIEMLGFSKMSLFRLNKRKELTPTTTWNGKLYYSGEEVYNYLIKKKLLTDDTIMESLPNEDKEKEENKDNIGAMRLRIKN